MKTIRKFIPVSLYDIPGLEAWLEEQADAGLFPTHLGSWAAFTDTGVPGTRFRLDPFANRQGEGLEPTAEKLELYQQAGWEYAFRIGRAYFLFYTTDPDAPELFTDYQSQGMSLDRLEKQVRSYQRTRTLVYSLLGLALVWVLFFFRSEFDVQPAPFARLPLALLHLFDPMLLILLPLAIFTWRIDRRNFRVLRNTCRALREGLPPPPSPGPQPSIVRENKILLALVLPLALLVAADCYYTYHWDGIPVAEFKRPYVAIQSLEQEEMVTYEELFGEPSSFHEDENVVEVQFSLLSPTWYEVNQQGYSLQQGTQSNGFSPDPEGGKYRYTAILDAKYFHLLIPAMAAPVARSALDSLRLVNVTYTYEEVDYPGLDLAILAHEEDGPWQLAVVVKGGRVAAFRYGGQEDLADHLDLLAETV